MTVFCTNCGNLIPPDSAICRRCGTFTDGVSEEKPQNGPDVLDREDLPAPYFPYAPRKGQMDPVRSLTAALDTGRHAVIESGTGTGKTIIALSSALAHAKPRNKRVVYLTRTISQTNQVMRELKAISSVADVSGMTLTGRGRSCPLLRTLAGYEDIPPNVLSSLCEDRKAKSMRNQAGGCHFFDKMRSEIKNIGAYCAKMFPTSEKLDEYCEGLGACSYEARKLLIKDADVVVAPYIHILSEDIRSNLLRNMDVADETKIVPVVDEAHNLVDAAREQESFSIPMKLVEGAVDECTTFRTDIALTQEATLSQFVGNIRTALRGIADDNLTIQNREALVPEGDLESRMMKRFNMGTDDLRRSVDRMIDVGLERTDLLLEKGENKVSELYTLGTALRNWISSEHSKYVRIVEAGEKGEVLRAACIDPNDVTQFLRSTGGGIHMSGTLEPLDQYVRVMGLPRDTYTACFPSPFPPENRRVVYVSNVTTAYKDMNADPSIFSRIEKRIAKLCNAVNKNTLVFFTSYSMMNRMRPFLERDVRKPMYWEESGQPRRTMTALNTFRSGRNGVFFTVMGGSIAEGIDFPGEELSFAIIVGIPYPPPTLESKAMSDMFDRRYGPWTGWKYVTEIPATRKMKQAIGRLIRAETDRGMAVILDKRASKYASELRANLTQDPVADAAEFFLEGEGFKQAL
ncbi:MAG: DEAD/DEAH box helicase family protein [Thermoplasmatales archaeon]|nr:DEAD/DEAH box helicase family protein [Thermoplasmatales archaeon]